MTLDQVLDTLTHEGFAVRAVARDGAPPSPWYLRVLLGFAGWIAGIMLVGSFAAAFAALFRNGGGSLFVGIVLCAAAALAFLRLKSDLASQFALAMSMCGQVLIAFSLMDGWRSGGELKLAISLAILQVVLVIVMRNTVHRAASAFFALGALAFAVGKWNHWALGGTLAALAYAELVVHESMWRTSKVAEIIRPVMGPLAIAVVAWYIPTEWIDAPAYLRGGPMLAIGISMALVLLAASASPRATPMQRVAAVAGTALFCLGAWRLPGAIASALVIGAGFRMGSRETMALGIAGFVAYLCAHYYFMAATLLAKSGSLAIAGAMLLVAAAAIKILDRGGKA